MLGKLGYHRPDSCPRTEHLFQAKHSDHSQCGAIAGKVSSDTGDGGAHLLVVPVN